MFSIRKTLVLNSPERTVHQSLLQLELSDHDLIQYKLIKNENSKFLWKPVFPRISLYKNSFLPDIFCETIPTKTSHKEQTTLEFSFTPRKSLIIFLASACIFLFIAQLFLIITERFLSWNLFIPTFIFAVILVMYFLFTLFNVRMLFKQIRKSLSSP